MTKLGEICLCFTTYVCNKKKYDFNLKKKSPENIECEVETRSMVKLKWLIFHFWLKIPKHWSYRPQDSKNLYSVACAGCFEPGVLSVGGAQSSKHWSFRPWGSKELKVWSGQGCGSVTWDPSIPAPIIIHLFSKEEVTHSHTKAFAQSSPWVSGTGQNSKRPLSDKWSEKLVHQGSTKPLI